MIEYTTLGNLIAPAKVIRCGKESFPVLSMTMHDGIVLQSERFKKSLASIDQSDYKVVKRGQLVVGFPIDEGVLYVQKAADEGIMSPAYNVWDIDTEKVDHDFLELCLHSPQSMQYYKDKLRGTTARRRSIPTADLLALKIRLPDMQTQREAVAITRKAEAVIAARQEQLAKLDQLVKSRFIELFGDPEDSTTKWERTNFASVCLDMHQGINTVADKVEYVNSGFPIIQSKNITSGFLDLEDVRYVKESDYEYYRTKYNPKPSDLLVCNIGTIGKSLIVENEVDFLIAWNLFLIKLNKEVVNPIFIKVFIELLNQQNYFEKYMTGGTVKFVNKKTMGNISTPLPPLELQEQFAAFVEQTDKSKLAIQQSLDKLETLKKALMQKYFG